jgi:hypothetical protein
MGARTVAQAGLAIGEVGEFAEALRNARAAEAAHLEAVYAFNDAKSLRLQTLKDELAVFIAGSPEAPGTFELVLVPGDSPRLWIDLVTSVVMEPDPKTYRLVQHGEGRRDIVLETADRAEMLQQVKLIIAHGTIARKRLKPAPGLNRQCYSVSALTLTGLGGFLLGVLTLLVGAIYLGILKF